jgi:hypothetical protein
MGQETKPNLVDEKSEMIEFAEDLKKKSIKITESFSALKSALNPIMKEGVIFGDEATNDKPCRFSSPLGKNLFEVLRILEDLDDEIIDFQMNKITI